MAFPLAQQLQNCVLQLKRVAAQRCSQNIWHIAPAAAR
jgi:hypothetical protein